MSWQNRIAVSTLAVLIGAALPAAAALRVADISLGTVQVEWQPTAEFAGMTLRVSGPLGVVEQEFAAGENPQFDLRSLESVADGLYTWEVVAAPRLDEGVRRAMAEARAAGDGAAEGRLQASGALPNAADMVQSGSFRVIGGAILQPTNEAEPSPNVRRVTSEATGGDMRRVTAEDQVIPDDLIVQSSLCVGFDCVNNENFGFDTIRLKENNTRIKFEDTSGGSFPSTDWQLTANESANGGQNKFSIEDITGARVPFTIEGGSITNSIYVDSTGRVGFRTSTPVLDLHVSTSNTPGIRLEQTNAGGFTAQSWDIAGNEANFFVRDVTGGSRLPFRIRPGAPTSSIDIANTGNVGIGTASPTDDLTLKSRAANSDVFVVQNSTTDNTPIFRVFETTSNDGLFSVFTGAGAEATRFTSVNGGRLALGCNVPEHTLDLGNTAGSACSASTSRSFIDAGSTTFTASSSRTIKENISPLAPEGILEMVAAIPVYRYDFIEGPKEKIGLMAEDFHQVFGQGSDKLLNGQEVDMALWLAVQQLARQNDALAEQNQDLRRTVEALSERLPQ